MNLKPALAIIKKINNVFKNFVYYGLLLIVLLYIGALTFIKTFVAIYDFIADKKTDIAELIQDHKYQKNAEIIRKHNEYLNDVYSKNSTDTMPLKPQKQAPTLRELWNKKLENWSAQDNANFGAFSSVFDSIAPDSTDSLHIVLFEKDSSGNWITSDILPFLTYRRCDVRTGVLSDPIHFSRHTVKETQERVWRFPTDKMKGNLLIGTTVGDTIQGFPSDSGKVDPTTAKQILKKFGVDKSAYIEKKTKLRFAGQSGSIKRVIVEIEYQTDTTDSSFDYGVYGVADYDTVSQKTSVQFCCSDSWQRYDFHAALNRDGRANIVVFTAPYQIELFVYRNGKWIRHGIYTGEEGC